MDQHDVKDAERLSKTARSCVGRIKRTTRTEEIIDWTEALLREGNPVRFGRMVFEVLDTEGRYYAGDVRQPDRSEDLWEKLRCRETLSLLKANEHGLVFVDVRSFARRAVKTWCADWGENPPSKLRGPV